VESLGKSSVDIAAVPTNLFFIKKKSFSCVKKLYKRPSKWVLGWEWGGRVKLLRTLFVRFPHLPFCPSASTWGHLTVALVCIQALV